MTRAEFSDFLDTALGPCPVLFDDPLHYDATIAQWAEIVPWIRGTEHQAFIAQYGAILANAATFHEFCREIFKLCSRFHYPLPDSVTEWARQCAEDFHGIEDEVSQCEEQWRETGTDALQSPIKPVSQPTPKGDGQPLLDLMGIRGAGL